MYARAGNGWLSHRADDLRSRLDAIGSDEHQRWTSAALLPSRLLVAKHMVRWRWPRSVQPATLLLPASVGIHARIEFTELFNKLTFDETSERGNVLARRGEAALSIVFGW